MALDPRGLTNDYRVAALAASGVIKNSPGRLYKVWGFNNNLGVQYIQFFNAAAVPADTTVPTLTPVRVPGQQNFELDLGELGTDFLTGITWSNSSTLTTKTIGAADVWLNALYR